MKRSRRGGAAQRAGACGVWLDTAELKQSAAQSLIGKPKVSSSRLLERKHALIALTQTGASQPRTKQTTISAFFGTRTDEKDKENSRPSPFSPSRDCKEKAISLAACPVKILALPQMEEARKQSFRAEARMVQVTPLHCAQKAPASLAPFPDSWLLEAQPRSRCEASCGAGEDCCCFSFTQDSEGNRIIAHRNESDVFAGETVSASGSVTPAYGINEQAGQLLPEEVKTQLRFQPRLGANQNKKPQQSSSVNSLIDFSETENINPAVTRDSTWAAGFYSSPLRPAGAQPLRERSQNAGAGSAEEGRSSPCRQLFTQDSEGNRVIAHRCQNLPSPREDNSSSRRQLPDSPYKGCSSDAANRSLSKPGEQQLDMCYELLFTQDSEGNRVIKHGEVTLNGSTSDLVKPQESIFR